MVKEDVKVVEDLCKYERLPFIEFSEEDYKYFIDKCMLNKELSNILELLIHGHSLIEIADKLKISEPTLSRRIKVLKKKIKRVL